MTCKEILSDACLCLWGILEGIFRGIYHFFLPPKRKSVLGWRILITGGGNGLGKSLSVQLARLGAIIVIWDIDEEGLQRTKDEVEFIGAKCFIYKCNLRNRQELISTSSRVKEEVGDIDMVINNAGVVIGKTLVDHTAEDVSQVFNVNVFAQLWSVECFLPRMMARNRGHIVSISSVAALFGMNRMGTYCASKAALNSYMDSLRYELLYGGYDGVHTTTVCPYFMNTDLFKGCHSKYPSVFPCVPVEQVARRAVQAILTNQITVYIPRIFYLLAIVKSILPVESMTVIHKVFGAAQLMDGFRGRHKSTNHNLTNGVTSHHEVDDKPIGNGNTHHVQLRLNSGEVERIDCVED